MTNISGKVSFSPRCNHCGGKLALIEEKTVKIENYASLITTKNYKCLNEECQVDIDKKTVGRIKLQKQQDLAKESRVKAKKGMRLNKKKISR